MRIWYFQTDAARRTRWNKKIYQRPLIVVLPSSRTGRIPGLLQHLARPVFGNAQLVAYLYP